MFEVTRKLLMLRELKLEKGETSLFGVRIIGIPAQIIASMLRIAENKNRYKKIANLQYEASKRAVMRWFYECKQRTKLKGDELLKWMNMIFRVGGWGVPEIKISDLKAGRVKFVVSNSAVAAIYLKKYGRSNYPVCCIVSGGTAGCSSHLVGKTYEVEEISCMTQGHPVCVHVSYEKNQSDVEKTRLFAT